MDNNDLGESSCRKKTNNDKMSEGERPLKKAKYQWQVKGKCHLKDQENVNENKQEDIDTSPDEPNENIDTVITPQVPSTTNNLEILGDYLLKQDFNIPSGDSSDSDGNSNKSDDDDIDVMSVSNTSNSIAVNRNLSGLTYSSSSGASSSNNDNHPSLVEEKNVSLDTYIARWQARQIAKGFVDNTINRVLDSWLVAPLPQTYDDTHNLALDVAEFFDNLPTSNSVENEGILMAISAHGLQNNQSNLRNNDEPRNQRRNYGSRMTIAMSECVSRNESHVINADNQDSADRDSIENINNISQNECLSKVDNKNNQDGSNVCQPIPTSSTSTSSSSNVKLDHRKSHSDNELSSTFIENRSSTNNTNLLNNSPWRIITQPCNCLHPAQRLSSGPNIPFHRRDSLAYPNNTMSCFSDLLQNVPPNHRSECHNDNETIDDITEEVIPPTIDDTFPEAAQSENENQDFDDHFDFMDAAVSFAIQNQGLTSFSSVDYG